jgi:hypothetical protein
MENHVKPFLSDLAELLEKEMKASNTVKLAGSSRSAGEVEVKPGEAEDKLHHTVKWEGAPGQRHWSDESHLPCITWFVGNPAEFAGKLAIRLETSFTVDGGWQKKVPVSLGASINDKVAKGIHKKLPVWVSNNKAEMDWSVRGEKVKTPPTKEWNAFIDRFADAAKKAGFAVPAKHDYGSLPHTSLKVPTKNTKVISEAEFTAIFKGMAL